jgi:hypothetical protein
MTGGKPKSTQATVVRVDREQAPVFSARGGILGLEGVDHDGRPQTAVRIMYDGEDWNRTHGRLEQSES